jgi:hypothetical protein
MNKQVFKGSLEINYDDGVIYFHADSGQTVLRVTHLKHLRRGAGVDMVAVPNLTSYPPLEFAQPEPAPDRCQICGKEHDRSNTFSLGVELGSLIIGHEYDIITRTSSQRRNRLWRMGFIGPNAVTDAYQFDARGPDRNTSDQYGGTVSLLKEDIVELMQVDRDKSKRHTGKVV